MEEVKCVSCGDAVDSKDSLATVIIFRDEDGAPKFTFFVCPQCGKDYDFAAHDNSV